MLLLVCISLTGTNSASINKTVIKMQYSAIIGQYYILDVHRYGIDHFDELIRFTNTDG